MGLLVYAVPKVVYEAPIQGLTGLWGGGSGALVGGGAGYDWDHIRFDVGTNVPSSETDDPPTLAYIKAGLSSPTGDSLVWKENTDRLSVDGGIITLLIPEDGNYKFTIRGADGAPFNTTLDPGNQTLGSSMYGAGATLVGTMALQKDQVVGMLMGMTPSGGESGSTGTAGGGGTFIYAAPAVGSNDGFGSNTLYFAAGGGGGWGHGKSTNTGGQGGQAPHNSITMAPGDGTGSGGSGGNSGGGTRNNGGGGKGGGSPTTNGNGGAGAGWQGAGGDSQSGCSGGNWTNEGLLEGGNGNQNGGWGGGGGACGNGIAGGGGGGYSGGDGGNGWDNNRWGGGAGGGSYTNPQATQTSGTTNSSLGEGQSGEHGFIQIEKL